MTESNERKHAIHNWSASKSWLACDLYYLHKMQALSEGLEWDRPNAASELGTIKHDVSERATLELCSNGRSSGWTELEIEGAIERAIFDLDADLSEGDIEHVRVSVSAVLDHFQACALANPSTVIEFEKVVELPHEPGSHGYVDVVIYNDEDAWVIDYKYGRTHVPPESPQLTGYCSSAAEELFGEGVSPKRFHRGIMQPAISDTISWAEPLSVNDLVRFQFWVDAVVELQRTGHALRGAANLSACEWCPAARLNICAHHDKMIVDMTDTIMASAYEGLPPEKVEQVVRAEKAIADFIKGAKRRIIEEEKNFPNWTRTQVRNPLRWNPAIEKETLEKAFAEKGVDPYVIGSPSQVGKSNQGFEEFISSLCEEQGHHIRLKENKK